MMTDEKPKLTSMKRSWSVASLASLSTPKICVCSPSMHPGSFRCKYHRNLDKTSAQKVESEMVDEVAPSSPIFSEPFNTIKEAPEPQPIQRSPLRDYHKQDYTTIKVRGYPLRYRRVWEPQLEVGPLELLEPEFKPELKLKPEPKLGAVTLQTKSPFFETKRIKVSIPTNFLMVCTIGVVLLSVYIYLHYESSSLQRGHE